MLPWVFATISAALKDQSVGSEMKVSIISDLKVCRSNSSEQDTGEGNSHGCDKIVYLNNPSASSRGPALGRLHSMVNLCRSLHLNYSLIHYAGTNL